MIVFGAHMPARVLQLFSNQLADIADVEVVNAELQRISGIRQCFQSNEEWQEASAALKEQSLHQEMPDRTEFGYFQTPPALAAKTLRLIGRETAQPDIFIEPTCGKGHFILAALREFPLLKKVHALDIYRPYVWETKFSLIDYFLQYPEAHKPAISIWHTNVFGFDFEALNDDENETVLVAGNPPWVTNAMLGSLDSTNLPLKSNFKQFNGIDAVTGKGNFDIAENIVLMLIRAFRHRKGEVALLIKNSVIRNIVCDQKKYRHPIADIRQYHINSQREFEVKAEASLFWFRLNEAPGFTCSQFGFYAPDQQLNVFGWEGDKYVSNLDAYLQHSYIDGISPLEWRQGLKHDCTSIMEFEQEDGLYRNARQHLFPLEEPLVYGLLKSSDLQQDVVGTARKFTIVTQQKPGADTGYIRQSYPHTFNYLNHYRELLEGRKSSIYKNKPPFSIFGIGSYSFRPYKIAISGLYKSFRFTLVLPQNGKPLMLDDTCYMLGFDNADFAVYTVILLNSDPVKRFLQSVSFADAKRTFTKEVLMRINLLALAREFTQEELQKEVEQMNYYYELGVSTSAWRDYLQLLEDLHVE